VLRECITGGDQSTKFRHMTPARRSGGAGIRREEANSDCKRKPPQCHVYGLSSDLHLAFIFSHDTDPPRLGRREQFACDLNRVPGFRCLPPDGAFYAWVDITGTGTSAEDLCRILLEDAGVAAIPGAAFGAAGKEFIRFSFASSRATLQEAVERIQKVSTAWQGTAAAL